MYFAYLTVMGVARLRLRPTVIALLTLASISAIGMSHVMPLVYLLIGYWLPALLILEPNVRLERLLLRFDRILFGADGLEAFAATAPRILLEYFELAYLLCYAVVPVGLAWLVVEGFEKDTARFWSTVLLAALGCYGLLPWLPTRAPRALEPPVPARSSIRALNLHVLNRASVQWNTFPSGHAAASVATALAVGSVIPFAGLVLGLVAASIIVGSVIGRYHYAADAIAGAAVAIVAFLTASAAHAP